MKLCNPTRSPWPVARSLFLMASFGCAEPTGPFLVLARTDEGYDLVAEEIPDLDDPVHLNGALGQVYEGGRLSLLFQIRYRPGTIPRVQYAKHDGVWVASDEQGLIALSFYHHLGELRLELEDLGYDLGDLFPMSAIAYRPSMVGDLMNFANAAYESDNHMFVLMPDASAGVPLAANEGIVRHETGHAWLHKMCTMLLDNEIGSGFHEGFSDMLAGFTLDDPRFMDASLRLEGRWMDGEQTWATVDSEVHSQGSVYAAWGWDLRLALDDRHEALERVIDATLTWCEDEEASDTLQILGLVLTGLTDKPTVQDDMCQATEVRFDELENILDEVPVGCAP